MPLAGGWRNVLKTFQDEYIQKLRDYPQAHVVMLIDFDGHVRSNAEPSLNKRYQMNSRRACSWSARRTSLRLSRRH